jgi:hypothetical protein
MFFTADQLVAHAVGDYVLQSDWMAQRKTKKFLVALAHAVAYSLPFLFLTQSWKAMVVIIGTHAVIDRFRLAKYVVWAKNFMAPPPSYESVGDPESSSIHTPVRWWYPWKECDLTGYPNEVTKKSPWLTVWLLIIADNLMHVTINALALRYL